MAAPALTKESIVSRLDEIPTLPAIVYELTKIVNNPMSSTGDVEKVMANDIGMTSKVLKLANSAYYAIPGGVTSLSRAIGYLGFDTVNQLVLSSTIIQALEVKKPQMFDLNEFWKHSMGVAIAAETTAKYVDHPLPADLFTAGLVHDMGKVALYSIETETMVRIVTQAETAKSTYSEAETALGLPTHTEIGRMLGKKWNLPLMIQAVIRYHHVKDHNQRGGQTAEVNRNIDIVYLANLFTHALKFGKSGHSVIGGIPREMMERLNLDAETDLKNLLKIVKDGFDKAADFIRILGATK